MRLMGAPAAEALYPFSATARRKRASGCGLITAFRWLGVML